MTQQLQRKKSYKEEKKINILYYCVNDFHRSQLFLYNKIMLGSFLVLAGCVLGEGGRAGREVVSLSWVVMGNYLFVDQDTCRRREPEKELGCLNLIAGFQNDMENDFHKM